ncbi:MAG: DnaJ domain-containing protein [Sphingobacteriales bacterium]|nr:DnaJ domain-containing protein [Sphingobacteriales bacterium]
MIDYYKILEIDPSATMDEIKRAYRRQALLFHPDKTQDDYEMKARFSLVKEAYETLTIRTLKEKYLNERWLLKANNKAFTNKIQTPSDVLKSMLAFHQKSVFVNEFSMDKSTFKEELLSVLSDENISILNSFDEQAINDEIIMLCLQNISKLCFKDQHWFLEYLNRINLKNTKLLDHFLNELKYQSRWEN